MSEARVDQLTGKSLTPGGSREPVADLETPAAIERILVEPAPADDRVVGLARDRLRRVADPASLPFMARDMTGSVAQRGAAMSVPHRLAVAENAEQRRHLGHPGVAQNQALGDQHEAILLQAVSSREHSAQP